VRIVGRCRLRRFASFFSEVRLGTKCKKYAAQAITRRIAQVRARIREISDGRSSGALLGFTIQPAFVHPTPVDESLPQFRRLRLLVIDDNPDGRFLLSKTLLRKFPSAALTECQLAETAFEMLERGDGVSLIVAHRTFELDGASLVRELRRRDARVPILMMSGIDRREAAIAAGANAFLTYEEWLMVGNHVAALLTNANKLVNGSGAAETSASR